MEATTRRSARDRTNKSAQDGVCKTLFVDEAKVASVLAAMPASGEIEGIADLFSVLSDPTRVRLLYALTREELCVCDLARIVGRSMPATSHQLQLLRRMHLVKYRMAGKLAYYNLDDSRVKRLVQDAVRQSNGGGAL